MSDKAITDTKVDPTKQDNRPEDVPDDQLEAVAGGHGHERYYHHWEGRRGYYRNGTFIQLDL
jgi:hypothetical protein